ncbi:MAG: N-acetylmuramoyl-L-alanine amidase [Caulobacteraceae bacterium]|nr:N-acetylmuramoyl-L-alanine amidase [Caulobacteraceae bacterium]
MWNWIKRLFGRKSETGQAPASPSLPSVSTTVSTPSASRKTYDERHVFTPNKQANRIRPEAIVLHHSDGSYLGGCEWIADPISRVSYHVLIARDGRRTVFANDTDRAWHAGVSSWNGRKDLNSWSLGVSWEGNTYDKPLGEDAMASAIEYLAPRMKKWGIPINMVVTHQQVAPTRKTDISAADAARFKSRLKAALN